ncbi:hypothetical protein EEJ39_07095 [Vibrio cholerae]|nr:hypothetical protein EEJ39_07095 [Vibrio cholerae]
MHRFIPSYLLSLGFKPWFVDLKLQRFLLHLLRISVITIARFGLFRSPDPAVFLSSYFYSK